MSLRLIVMVSESFPGLNTAIIGPSLRCQPRLAWSEMKGDMLVLPNDVFDSVFWSQRAILHERSSGNVDCAELLILS